MATYTTNLDLIKPAGTDKIRIAQINQNMDTIDNAIGAVGNTSLQSQITTNSAAITALQSSEVKGLDTASDLDTVANNSICITDNNTLHKPANDGNFVVFTYKMTYNGYGFRVQYATESSGSNTGRVYTRVMWATWKNWTELAPASKVAVSTEYDVGWGESFTVDRISLSHTCRITGGRQGIGFIIFVPKGTNEYVIIANNNAITSVTVSGATITIVLASSGYGSTAHSVAEVWS